MGRRIAFFPLVPLFLLLHVLEKIRPSQEREFLRGLLCDCLSQAFCELDVRDQRDALVGSHPVDEVSICLLISGGMGRDIDHKVNALVLEVFRDVWAAGLRYLMEQR